jgi:hypothetical protein
VQYHPECTVPIRTYFIIEVAAAVQKEIRDVVKHLPKFGTNRLNTFKYYNGTKKFDLNSIIGFALIFGILVLSCTKTNRIQKWLQLKSSKRVTD